MRHKVLFVTLLLAVVAVAIGLTAGGVARAGTEIPAGAVTEVQIWRADWSARETRPVLELESWPGPDRLEEFARGQWYGLTWRAGWNPGAWTVVKEHLERTFTLSSCTEVDKCATKVKAACGGCVRRLEFDADKKDCSGTCCDGVYVVVVCAFD